MSAAHTPGPWFTFANGQCVGGPVGPLGNPSGAGTSGVAHCGMGLRTGTEVQANAQLCAASVDLLQAAQAAWNCIGELPPTQARVEVAEMLQAAIERATGAES